MEPLFKLKAIFQLQLEEVKGKRNNQHPQKIKSHHSGSLVK